MIADGALITGVPQGRVQEPPSVAVRMTGLGRLESSGMLWDARREFAEFVANRTWEEYHRDPTVRSAVERQFLIIGEVPVR